MAQQAYIPATKNEDPSLSPRLNLVEGKTQLLQVFL